MPMFRNPTALKLGGGQTQLNLTPSPERSIYIQQLMARALQNNGRGSRSLGESLDIASAPIIGALLGNVQQKAQQQQLAKQTQLANQLLGGVMQKNIQLENLDGQAPDNFSVPSMGPTDQRRQALASALAQSPQAMTALAMQQAMPQQQKMEPLSPEGKIMADMASGAIPQQLGSQVLGVAAHTDPGSIQAQQIARQNADLAKRTALDTQINQVSDDLNKQSSTFLIQRDALSRIRASAADPSAAGDMSMIFSYMKLLDPTSVVRESEFANAENARGVPETIRNLYNKVLTGEKLSDAQRADFSDRAERLFTPAKQDQINRNDRFLKRAKASGIPEEVFKTLLLPPDPSIDRPSAASPQSAPPVRVPAPTGPARRVIP